METHPDPPPLDEASAVATSSLPGRLFNVFAAPGELFDELRYSPVRHVNWLVPLVLSIAVGILFSTVAFSQPDLVAQVFRQQEEALSARVEKGKITQEQADRALQGMRQFQNPKFMMLMGSVGASIGGVVFLVILSCLLWLLTAKILGGTLSLAKAFELTGLAGTINVLGGLVTLMLVLLKGNIAAGPSAALLLGTGDQGSYLYQYLAALNVMTLWYLAVLSIGAAKLAGRSPLAAGSWIFGCWVVVRFGLATATAWWIRFQANL